MTINFGAVPLGAVLPIHFASYDSTGASVTLTGLAVTDVEIYKGTSVTQRSSDAGYALIDTDGIDIDGITGAHGFSIDTGDNTDAGFFVAGSFYNVWVSAVTIDSQTVNFLAATFRLTVAESLAGAPKADVYALGGVVQSATDLKDFADDGYDPATNKVQGVVLTDTVTTYTGNTPQTGDSFALANGGNGFVAIKGDTAAILVDTGTTLDARIPAALVGGRMDSSAGAMTPAALKDFFDTDSTTTYASAVAGSVVKEIADNAGGSSLTVNDIADGVWVRVLEGAITAEQFMRGFGAALLGTASGLDTTNPLYDNASQTKNVIDATTDAFGNRSAVTLDLT